MVHKIETVIDSNTLPNCYDDETISFINSKYIKLINKSKEFSSEFLCFNYALENVREWVHSCEEAYDILEEEYKQINIRQAKKGDIISYHEIINFKHKYERPCCDNALHFAIIEKTKKTLKSTIIKSKWGDDGVFETFLYDVPDSYGNAIVIWRKKK